MTLQLVPNKTEDKTSTILQGLNPQQRKAVETINGPLLVIAGAGSGKTRVLTFRIAYMIERGVSPYNILSLTFTNKAAEEMKERIASLVGADVATKITAGTFHSVFARLLRYEAASLGYTSSFSIYDADDSLGLIKNIMNNMGFSIEKVSPQSVRSRISSSKNQIIGWQEFANTADNSNDKQIGQIYEAYEKWLRINNAMDFDDLLLNMYHLLNNFPNILDKYQERFKYLLVDEYQDTNRVQYLVLKKLADKYRNICVVGDDAQSIYRWRGADIRNILDFQKDYPNAETVPLEQNYRSTKTILAAADSVIKNNRRQIHKTLWTDNIEGEPIEVISCPDDRDESDSIVSIIKSKISGKNYSLKDIALLYRTNAQSLALENAFRRENLSYIIIGGISFYKRKEIKDTLCYLKLLVNPNDGESILRVVNEPPRGLGQTSLKHIIHYAQERSIPIFEAFKRAGNIEALQKRAVVAVQDFVSKIEGYISQKDAISTSELVLNYIESTGLLQMYKEINTEDSLDRWNNIQQLLSDITSYFRREKDANLEDYIQQITLVADIDEKDTTQNQVKLMTLHSAKGLEFPIVFITGMEQGLFPMSRADLHPDEEEEERRLFYVGITRAKEKLYLTHARRRLRFGEYTEQNYSAFIKEIKSDFLKWSGSGASNNKFPAQNKATNFFEEKKIFSNNDYIKSEQKPSYDFNNSAKTSSRNSNPEFNLGDKVKHATFGYGKIEVMTGEGDNVKVVVRFQDAGRKVLMIKYAKLEKIKKADLM